MKFINENIGLVWLGGVLIFLAIIYMVDRKYCTGKNTRHYKLDQPSEIWYDHSNDIEATNNF